MAIKEFSSLDIANRHKQTNILSDDTIDTLIINDSAHILTPNTIRSIADTNKSIKNIEVKNNDCYYSVNGLVFNKSMTSLIVCPRGKTGHITLPQGLRIIKAMAFKECKIGSVKLPDSLQSLEEKAFYGCKKLKKLDFGNGIINIGSAYSFHVFASCNIEYLEFPDQIKNIGPFAFYDNNIKTLKLPDGIMTIGLNAFSANKNLKEVTIPESLCRIGERSFASAKKIHIKKYVPGFEAAITENIIYAEKNAETVIIEANGNEMVVPRHIRYPEVAKNIIEKFINGEDTHPESMCLLAYLLEERHITAIQIYKKTKREDIKNYLKGQARPILAKMIKEKKSEDAVEFINFNILSKRTLKELLNETYECPEVAACILKKLHDNNYPGSDLSL